MTEEKRYKQAEKKEQKKKKPTIFPYFNTSKISHENLRSPKKHVSFQDVFLQALIKIPGEPSAREPNHRHLQQRRSVGASKDSSSVRPSWVAGKGLSFWKYVSRKGFALEISKDVYELR